MNKFAFELGDDVMISCSKEKGTVIARSESLNHGPQYMVRYVSADGRAVEAWWDQDALVK